MAESGEYGFFGEGDADMFGLLYKSQFDPQNSAENLMGSDDDSGDSYAFNLRMNLEASRRYILVVTTFRVLIPTAFNVIAYSSDGEIWFRNGTGPTQEFIKCKQRGPSEIQARQ